MIFSCLLFSFTLGYRRQDESDKAFLNGNIIHVHHGLRPISRRNVSGPKDPFTVVTGSLDLPSIAGTLRHSLSFFEDFLMQLNVTKRKCRKAPSFLLRKLS